MNNLYHVFRVYNYKGGELSHYVNMLKSNFIEFLIETFEIDSIKEEMLQADSDEQESFIIDRIEEEWSEYAGSGIVLEIFMSSEDSSKLTAVDLYTFVPDILDYIKSEESAEYVLLTYSDSYADEFDIDSYSVMSLIKWNAIAAILTNLKNSEKDVETEIYFGTNEYITITANTLLQKIIVRKITKEEADIIKNYFGKEFGVLSFNNIIETLTEIENE